MTEEQAVAACILAGYRFVVGGLWIDIYDGQGALIAWARRKTRSGRTSVMVNRAHELAVSEAVLELAVCHLRTPPATHHS